MQGEKLAGQFEHVIDVAAFVVAAVHVLAQLVRGIEVFVVAVAAGGVTVMEDDLFPEELGGVAVGLVAGIKVAGKLADHFGHLGVAVFAAENVVVRGQGIDHGFVFKFVGESQPAQVAGVVVKIGQDFIHAAEFGVEHALVLGVRQTAHDGLDPGGEFDFDGQRHGISGAVISVAQAGEDFVLDVPGGPHSVQIEAAGFNDAVGQFAETPLAVHHFAPAPAAAGAGSGVGAGPAARGVGHERAQVAIALFVLNFLQFADEIVRALLELRIAGGGVHITDGGKIVPGDVAGELAARAVPAPVAAVGLVGEPGPETQVVEHPVGLELEQVFGVQFLGVLEGAAGQAHGGQRQRLRGQRDRMDVHTGGLGGGGQNQSGKSQRRGNPDGRQGPVWMGKF